MKQVIVIRKDLKLSVGKIVAQAVHAAQRNTSPRYTLYKEEPTCIVCYVKSEQQLLNLYEKCSGIVPAVIQRDGGKNEVEKGTPTALNIGPYANHEVLDELTKKLQTVKAEVIWGPKCDMDINDMSEGSLKVLYARLKRKIRKEIGTPEPGPTKLSDSVSHAGTCSVCNWPALSACNNDNFSDHLENDFWDWYAYCTNKSCINHAAEGYSQEDPEWLNRTK